MDRVSSGFQKTLSVDLLIAEKYYPLKFLVGCSELWISTKSGRRINAVRLLLHPWVLHLLIYFHRKKLVSKFMIVFAWVPPSEAFFYFCHCLIFYHLLSHFLAVKERRYHEHSYETWFVKKKTSLKLSFKESYSGENCVYHFER